MTLYKKSGPFSLWLHSVVLGLVLLLGAETAGAQIRTVLVSPVPGNPVASGTALRNALAGISSPSATNRWLLKIEPGIYDVGTTSLNMRSWVDIEGSGIGVTTIRGSNPIFDDVGGDATVHGADNAELRLLTVEAVSTTGAPGVMAMANYSASPRLYRVKLTTSAQVSGWGIRTFNAAPLVEECEISVTATTTGGEAYGLVFGGFPPASRSSILRSKVAVSGATGNYGIYMVDSLSLTSIRDSRFDVTGGSSTQGLYVNPAGWSGHETLTIRDTEVNSLGASTASYGIRFEGGTISLNIFGSMIWGHAAPTSYGIYAVGVFSTGGIQGSTITGATKAVQFGGNISIASTFLQGGPTTAGGWLGCMGVWDENGIFYANSCP